MAITPTVTSSRDDSGLRGGSSNRDELINFNRLLDNVAYLMEALGNDAAMTTGTLARGTTVTLATGAQTITINGVPTALTAQTAQAFGALGTIPASTWGIIAVERVAAGTTTFVSGAANYTTGYSSETNAIAALPAQSADKVRVGYVTVLASASTWIAGTDALTGGTGGNPATTTNYYNTTGAATQAALTAKQIGNMGGVVISA